MQHLLSLVLILASVPTAAPQRSSAPQTSRWPAGNAVISRSEMCKPENRAMLGPLRIAGIHWGGALYADDEMARKRPGLLRQINMVHAAGAKYIGSINGRGLLLRGMDDEAVRLLDGSPFRHEGMNNAVYKCSLNPKVHAALLQAAQQSIDIGMDGLILDSWQAEGQMLCFCKVCLQFYRDCLGEHRDDPRLKDLAGIETSQFDYGEYLRTRGLSAGTPTHKLPLGQAFQDYRFRELLNRKRSLLTDIRQYARRRGRSPFYLTANVYSMQPITFAIDDLLDYFSVELPYFGSFDGCPPRCTSIALLKKAHAVGKRCVLQPGCHDTARALIGQKSTSTLFKIWVAEACATGHLFDLIPQEFAGYENGQVVWLKMPVDDLLPYYRFVQAHPELYLDRTSLARVAVLYSLPAAKVETPEFEREYQAVCKILHDCHYQFDVILSGDGEWGHKPVSLADLARYESAVVIRPQLLDAQTAESLMAYAAQGRKLLPCGQSRTKRPESEALCRRILGQEIPPQQMPSFLPYIKSLDGNLRDRLVRDLGPDLILSTDAPPTVGVLCWKSKSRTAVHLLNYAYDQATDSVTPAENVKLRVRASARRVTLLSPDGQTAAKLELKSEEEYASCVVPRVQIYSVAVFE